MNVLMITKRYGVGGSSTVIDNLAKNLSKRGVSITIGAFRFSKKAPNWCKSLRLNNISNLSSALGNYDLIHSHQPVMNYLSLLTECPFIYHYHGVPHHSNLGFKEKLYQINLSLSARITTNRIDSVILVSKTALREYKKYSDRDTNLSVVHNGVDTNLFNPKYSKNFREGNPQFLFVGNLYPHKKVDELIYATEKLMEIYPDTHLQIIGEGEAYNYLEKLIKKLNLENTISLEGRVPTQEIPTYYNSCDVYLSASRWELFGLPLLEAMACGKPVVASSIPAHEELIRKSKAGLTYNPGKIEDLRKKIIDVYEKRSEIKQKALNFAKKYDWSKIAEEVINIYQRVRC